MTIDPNVQRLAALNGYVDFIASLFPNWETEENPLVLTLAALRMTLERRIAGRVPTVEWTNAMKWAVTESNRLLDNIYDLEFEHVENWNPMDPPANPQQALAAVLMTLCHELRTDISIAEQYLAEELKEAAEEFAKEIWTEYES
jgi:hypothetical protein